MDIEYLHVEPAVYFRGDGRGGYMTQRVFRLAGTSLLMRAEKNYIRNKRINLRWFTRHTVYLTTMDQRILDFSMKVLWKQKIRPNFQNLLYDKLSYQD